MRELEQHYLDVYHPCRWSLTKTVKQSYVTVHHLHDGEDPVRLTFTVNGKYPSRSLPESCELCVSPETFIADIVADMYYIERRENGMILLVRKYGLKKDSTSVDAVIAKPSTWHGYSLNVLQTKADTNTAV